MALGDVISARRSRVTKQEWQQFIKCCFRGMYDMVGEGRCRLVIPGTGTRILWMEGVPVFGVIRGAARCEVLECWIGLAAVVSLGWGCCDTYLSKCMRDWTGMIPKHGMDTQARRGTCELFRILIPERFLYSSACCQAECCRFTVLFVPGRRALSLCCLCPDTIRSEPRAKPLLSPSLRRQPRTLASLATLPQLYPPTPL